MHPSFIATVLAGVLPAILLPGGAETPPVAHVELRSSSPAAEAAVDRSVDEIVLAFTGPVQAELSRIEIMGPGDEPVAVGEVESLGPDARDRIRAPVFGPLEPGRYDVIWRTAALDGHVVVGSFSFQVEETPPDPAPVPPLEPQEEEPPAPEPEPAVAERRALPDGTGTRWLHLLGLTLFLGAVASRYGVLPLVARNDAFPELRLRLRTGFWRAGWIGIILLVLALPLRFYHQFWGGGAEWTAGEIGSFLFGTAWGAGWFLHLGVAALGVAGLLLAAPQGRSDRGWTVLGAAALLLPLVPALQGHAWGVEGLRGVAVASLYLHVVGVGIWLGGLVLLLVVGLGAVRAEGRARTAAEGGIEEGASEAAANPHPPLAVVVNAFSRMALPAVALFLVTGAVNAWIHTGGSLGVYLGTTYGRTLLLKLGLVAVVLALGFYNWRKVRPALADHPDAGMVRIPASVEAVVGILVLLITAVLVATPLP